MPASQQPKTPIMAKGKGNRSAGANMVPVKGGVDNKTTDAGADALPQIEESAFAGLRQKIEQRLKDGAAKQKSKNSKSKAAPTDNAKNSKEIAGKSDSKSASVSDKGSKGKKRDRNGEVIARDENKEGGKTQKAKSGEVDGDETLRQEILALGGTEEDFDLVAGIESESDVEDTKASKSKGLSDEASLRKELSNMLAAAGQVVPDDIEDEEVEQEEAEIEEEDDGEDEAEAEEDAESDEEEPSSESESPAEEAKQPTKKEAKETKKESKETIPEVVFPKEFSKLTVRPRSDWYMTELPPVSTKQATGLPKHLVDRVHNYAISLLEQENKEYSDAQQASASSSYKFYSTIMTTGTLSDKISALTLAVQESPLHNTKSLENLISLGKKRSRAQAVDVLRSLKDMFSQGTLLPGDRRLRIFAHQPALIAAFQGAGSKWSEGAPLPGGLQKSHLIVWAYEHFLKDQYFEMIKILEVWCNDEIEFSRSRAVSYVYELLKEKPEQEANLLRLLVNKLGDTSKKIASRASYLLLQLEQAHALMKPTIIKAVEEVLFRPGQSQHAKYYSIITLNQTVLSVREEEVAVQLLDIYFALFVVLLKPTKAQKFNVGKKHGKGDKKRGKGDKNKGKDNSEAQTEEMQDKLISAVLTGVNRAYPFTNSNTERLSKHIETLFRITHSSNFNTSIQALMLIQQLTSSHQVSSDRFYRTLYESLLDPRVATSSKQSLYLNLLFKSLKNDVNVSRVKAFVKRIVQVLGLHQPSFTCGVFYLIRELEKAFRGLQTLYDQPEDNESDDEEVFRDVPDEDDEQAQPAVAEEKPRKPRNGYDPRKRDPEHSNADKACLWELLPYLSHFHPSVSVNAAHLLENRPMSGKPDLTIHTLTHFLDRFVYRTPKASASTRGTSLMQPLAGSDAKDRLVTAAGKHAQQLPLNSEAFWKQKAEDVLAEDVFFHEYFSRLGKDKEKANNKKSKDPVERDEEEDDLSDAESEVWKALVDSRPEVDGADSDDDLDLDDLESAYDKSDEEGGDDEVIFNDESDEEMEDVEEAEFEEKKPAKTRTSKSKEEDEFDDEDAFDMDVSDEEAFVGSDEELPSDVEVGGVELPKEDDKAGRKKRRKLKHLPTFASADDYAALLAGEDEGM
ncbi:CBF/Mak21 family-domain-containing protein [Aspergillus egyptiacus]|nr:CBF/Mak21 family-domain-containing protein [Aspergillus egyptiacus]